MESKHSNGRDGKGFDGVIFEDIEPYYSDESVAIYCCDSTEFIDAIMKSGALVYADPPYGVGERTERKRNGRACLAECNDFPPVIGDDRPFDPLPWLRCSKLVLWGANHYASRLPDSPTWLTWDKRDGLTSNDNADCELAWTNLGGPSRLFHHTWNGMIKASERGDRRIHPTQKPVALAAWVLRMYAKPGDLVIDPYMGSGSTLIAAKQEGLQAIGLELSETYCANAAARIRSLGGQRQAYNPAPTTKRCSHCSRSLRVLVGVTFNRKGNSRDGLQPWCRECDMKNKPARKNGYKNLLRELKSRNQGESSLWTELDYEAVMTSARGATAEFWRCSYCGNDVTEWGSGYWLDRINPARGYEPSNCRPCCKPCNYLKSNDHKSEWDHTIREKLNRNEWGKVPWDLISNFKHKSAKIPDLSEFVVPETTRPQIEMFGAA